MVYCHFIRKIGEMVMNDDDKLEALADQYRRDGYDVILKPAAGDRPDFLKNADVLLLARREGEYRAGCSAGSLR